MKGKKKYQPWLYSSPAMILIGIIIVFPILYTGFISLTNMNLFHWLDYRVIGLENFKRDFFRGDAGLVNQM